MSIAYCPDCGRANQFMGTKPLYCGFCQAALSVGTASIQEPAPRRQVVARRDDRRPIRRPEPEPVYEDDPLPEDDDYYDDPRGRRSSLSNIRITLVDQDVKEKREPERTPVRMDEVLGGGALGAANSGPVARPEELRDKSYTGGDKKTFAKNFLNQQVFSSAKNKPAQEVGPH